MTEARPAISETDDFDFYRCYKCNRLITKLEEIVARTITGQICPCGSRKYTPSNLPWWGWFLPKVWIFAYRRIRRTA